MGRDVFKGDVPVLVMAVLRDGPCHGYAIAREIERRSGAKLSLKEGTLYPALRVLEQNGFIAGKWDEGAGGPARKTYALTSEGEAELAKREGEWRAYASALGGVLELKREAKGGENAESA